MGSNSPTVQQHWARSTGVLDDCKDLCQQLKSQFQKWTRSFERSRKGQTAVQADSGLRVLKAYPVLAWVTSGSASPGVEIIVLRLRHQAGGMKVADSTELTRDDPRVSASLMVLCTFLSILELQPELSETLVSGAQQGRCKINRIWSAARDLTRLQRLWYFTEAQNKNQLLLLPSVCYCFHFLKKALSRTNKTKQRRLILLCFRSKAHSDRLAHWLSICHMLSSFFF